MAVNAQQKQAATTAGKRRRRSILMICLYLTALIIYIFDKVTLDTQLVDFFKWLDEDNDSIFNPDMVEATLTTILVLGVTVSCLFGAYTAKQEE